MTKDEFQTKVDEILTKVGDEKGNLILDDIATLINDNSKMNEDIVSKDKDISELKKRNDMLQKVNGNLLMQVSVAPEEPKKEPSKDLKDNGKPVIDFRKTLDKNGNFLV